MKKTVIYLNILALLAYPLLAGFSIPLSPALPRAQAEGETLSMDGVDEIFDGDWAESSFDKNEVQRFATTATLANKLSEANNMIAETGKLFAVTDTEKIVIGQEDVEAVREGKIDDGLLKTLSYLVTPVAQGGAGFERIKIKRLMKNYTTEKRSQSRESEYDEGETPNISAHYKGQAVDISEIDWIKFKKRTKKKAGFGKWKVTYKSSETALPSVPINVAWQSDKGKGEGMPSFAGKTPNQTFENLSLMGLKMSLGDVIDYNLEDLAGSDFPEWAQSLGAIMMGEDLELPEGAMIKGIFVTKSNVKDVAIDMGRAFIAKSLKLSPASVQGDNAEDLALNIGKGLLEKKMELAPGSLTGESIEEIAKSAGKRKLEQELKLKPGTLDGDFKAKYLQIKNSKIWKTYGKAADNKGEKHDAKDSAFDMPGGSAGLIEKGDDAGLMLVGAGALAYALAVSNKKDVYKKIKNKQSIEGQMTVDQASIKVDVEPDTLKLLVSKDKTKRRQALIDLGKNTLATATVRPDLGLGLTRDEWSNVISGKVKIDDLAMKVGARKYEQELNLPNNAVYYNLQAKNLDDFLVNIGRAQIEEIGGDPSRYTRSEQKNLGAGMLEGKAISMLNKKYKLTGKYAKYGLTQSDIFKLFQGDWKSVAQKIASHTMDRAMRLPSGGIMDIVNKEKTPERVLKEAGAVMFGNLLGVNGAVSMEGNIVRNYGQAIVEDTLGLEKGTFINSRAWTVIANPTGKFYQVFGDPVKVDGLLGLPKGTSKDFLDDKIAIEKYQERAAQKKIVKLTASKIIDSFGWEEKYKISGEDINVLINTLTGWDLANPTKKKVAFDIFGKTAMATHDQAKEVEPGTTLAVAKKPNDKTNILLGQGMKRLNTQVFGFEHQVISMRYQKGKPLTFVIDKKSIQDWGAEKIGHITGITSIEDTNKFLNGNIKEGFMCWGIAAMTKEANESFKKNGLASAQFTYEDARKSYFGDRTLESDRMDEAEVELRMHNPEASTAEINDVRNGARVEVRGELRKDFQYKVYDAYIINKIDKSLPVGFTKILYEGTPEQRTEMMSIYLRNKLIKGDIWMKANQTVAIKTFIQTGDISVLEKSGVTASLDKYFNQHGLFGFKVQPGTSAALLKAIHDPSGGLLDLQNIYADWARSKIFAFFDKKMGFPAGQTYQLYKTYTGMRNAFEALKAAKLAGDKIKIAAARSNVTQLRAAAWGIAISLVAGKTLLKVDEKLGLAPGTSQNIAMFFVYGDSVNPVALVYLAIAIVSNIFSTEEEYYGQTPVCEQSTTKKARWSLFKKRSAGWEKLSGDGEKDFGFYQRHAQCAVKRMDAALLNAGEATDDPNAQPTQILTLRQEDADYLAEKNAEIYGATEKERGSQGLMWSAYFWQYVHVGY